MNAMQALKDPRTTASGFALGVVGLLSWFGVEVPQIITDTVITVGAVVLMLVARDKSEG